MGGFAEIRTIRCAGACRSGAAQRRDTGRTSRAAIERVEARNPAVNAVTMKLYDHGRKAIADGLPDGPFRACPSS